MRLIELQKRRRTPSNRRSFDLAFAGRVGRGFDLAALPMASADGDAAPGRAAKCFAETPSRYLLEVAPDRVDAAVRSLRDANVPFGQVGTFAEHDRLTLRDADGPQLDVELDTLRNRWLNGGGRAI